MTKKKKKFEELRRDLYADDALELLELLLERKRRLYHNLKSDLDWICTIDYLSDIEGRLYLKLLDLLDEGNKENSE